MIVRACRRQTRRDRHMSHGHGQCVTDVATATETVTVAVTVTRDLADSVTQALGH